MVEIATARAEDVRACVDIAAAIAGPTPRGRGIQAAFARRELLVARAESEVVGMLAFRGDWFTCALVTLVTVRSDWRRRGVARALYDALEGHSPSPRLFSSVEETNAAGIQMHRALGFAPSGHVDNLPQGHRELLFYKRLTPMGLHGTLKA